MVNKNFDIEKAQYADEKQIARLTGLSLQHLRNMRSVGKLFPYIKIGKSVRYRLSDVIATMEKYRINITDSE